MSAEAEIAAGLDAAEQRFRQQASRLVALELYGLAEMTGAEWAAHFVGAQLPNCVTARWLLLTYHRR